MDNAKIAALILDGFKDPVVFVDTEHIIRYMNKTAVANHEKDGGRALIGKSVLDCHNEGSRKMIREIYEAMLLGEEERLITDSEKHRIFMRSVRDEEGNLLGYFERYEPPQ